MGLSVDSAIFAGLTTETDGPRYSVCNSRPRLANKISVNVYGAASTLIKLVKCYNAGRSVGWADARLGRSI